MKKLICFDLDNTLVYSDKAHISACNEALKKLGLKEKSSNFLKNLFGMPHSEIARILLAKFNKKLSNQFLIYYNKFLIQNCNYVKAIPGVKKTLIKLSKNYDLAILSNCSKSTIKATLKGAKINLKLFKILIGNDNVKRSKPYPDEILKAEKLEHHKPYFMVGDSIYDIIAGNKAKVKTIAVLTGHSSKNKLKKYHPNFILKSVNEVLRLLNFL